MLRATNSGCRFGWLATSFACSIVSAGKSSGLRAPATNFACRLVSTGEVAPVHPAAKPTDRLSRLWVPATSLTADAGLSVSESAFAAAAFSEILRSAASWPWISRSGAWCGPRAWTTIFSTRSRICRSASSRLGPGHRLCRPSSLSFLLKLRSRSHLAMADASAPPDSSCCCAANQGSLIHCRELADAAT